MTLTQIKGQTRPPQTEGRFEFNGLHWMTSFFKKDCSVTSKELRRVLRRSMRSAREWSLTTAGTVKLEKLIEVRNMQQDTKPKPSLLGAETAKVADLVTYQDGSIVSREIMKKPTGTVTVFAFDEGARLKRTHCSVRCAGPGVGRRSRNQYRRQVSSCTRRRDDSHASTATARAQGAAALQDDSHDDSVLKPKAQISNTSVNYFWMPGVPASLRFVRC